MLQQLYTALLCIKAVERNSQIRRKKKNLGSLSWPQTLHLQKKVLVQESETVDLLLSKTKEVDLD